MYAVFILYLFAFYNLMFQRVRASVIRCHYPRHPFRRFCSPIRPRPVVAERRISERNARKHERRTILLYLI